MYKSSAVTDSVSLQPQQVWGMLDSFWRNKVRQADADLIKYQTFATLVLCANNAERSAHFINAQSIATLEPYAQVPWYPIIIYKDQLSSSSYYLYGGGQLYNIGGIVYGQSAGTSYQHPVLPTFADVPTLYDSVTDTKYIFDKGRFSFDSATQSLTFNVDPFTVVPSKLTTGSREYIILWARNATLDLNVPFDWMGWTVQYKGAASIPYVKALKDLWALETGSSNSMSWKSGVTTGAGFPVAEFAGTVTDILTDGYQRIIIVGDKAYTTPIGITAAVAIGDEVTVGQPLTNGVKFFTGLDIASASSSDVPGIAFSVPLTSGQVVSLFAPNQTLAWSYDVSRPSPWRFPLGGTATDVAAYWADRNVDLSAYYTLAPGDPVNPMELLVSDLWKSAMTVAAVDLTLISNDALSFADRAILALSPATYLIIQQKVAAISDALDLSAATEVVGYGYHVTATVDIISVAATDLILSDYAPLVVLS